MEERSQLLLWRARSIFLGRFCDIIIYAEQVNLLLIDFLVFYKMEIRSLVMAVPQKKIYILAFVATILAFLCFSLMDSIIRYLGNELPTVYFSLQQRFFTCLVLLFTMLAISIKNKSLSIFKIRHPVSLFTIGIFLFAITMLFVRTFTLLPLSNAYSIIFSLPLFTVLFARLFIKEKISMVQLSGIFGGFLGILVILQPGLVRFSFGYVFALLGVGLEAPMFVMIRHYHKEDHPFNIAFYSNLVALLLLFITELIYNTGASVVMDYRIFTFIMLFAVISVINQFLLNFSLKYLKAGLSLSMQFSQIIWGAIFGYIFFKDTEYNISYFIGTAIIIFCSVIVTTNKIPFVKTK